MKCHGCCAGSKAAWVLVLIGALNWGLVGAFGLDLVQVVLGSIEWLADLVYILIGLSAILLVVGCPCGKCKGAKCMCKPGKGGQEGAKRHEGGHGEGHHEGPHQG